jgi:succinate dehydrogenase / fumarate reductase cytochrome b subunit
MSQTLHRPQAYKRGARARIIEGLRYGGGIGQWSWLVHRITGLGILLFLIVHIIDTFFVVAYPGLYDHTVAIYGGTVGGLPEWLGVNGYWWVLRWGFRFAELGLIACVLFHAINGVRIILFDFWPGAVVHQKQIFAVVMGLFMAIMLPVTAWVFYSLWQPPAHHGAAATAPVGGGASLAPIGAGR